MNKKTKEVEVEMQLVRLKIIKIFLYLNQYLFYYNI